MKRAVADVKAFHRAAEQPILDTPHIPATERVALRKSLIREEVGETLVAIDEGDLVEIADGIADSIVVLIGTALEFGIPLERVWAEVHRSNMTKFPPCESCGSLGVFCADCNGRGTQLLLREDGKVLKGPDWEPPGIAEAIGVCVFCHAPLNGACIGAGDGTGQRFAHPACHAEKKKEPSHG